METNDENVERPIFFSTDNPRVREVVSCCQTPSYVIDDAERLWLSNNYQSIVTSIIKQNVVTQDQLDYNQLLHAVLAHHGYLYMTSNRVLGMMNMPDV
jgi:hypothetical protein